MPRAEGGQRSSPARVPYRSVWGTAPCRAADTLRERYQPQSRCLLPASAPPVGLDPTNHSNRIHRPRDHVLRAEARHGGLLSVAGRHVRCYFRSMTEALD